MPDYLQPVAIESRYVCHVHQQYRQTSKRGRCASARGNHYHGNNHLTSLDRHLSTDIDNETPGRVMMSSIGQPDSDVEARVEDRLLQDDEQAAAAADVDEEPVWIVRSPCNSTQSGNVWRHRQRGPDVNPTCRQLAAEVLRPDDGVIRRRKKKKTKKNNTTSECHRAHALFVWKRAIVEWRAMSAVVDRLLFFVFLVATLLIYVTILVVVPMMKTTATVNSPSVTVIHSDFAA